MLQPQLEVGESDDAYEKEADAVAEQVMRMPHESAPPADVSDPSPRAHVLRRRVRDEETEEEGLQVQPSLRADTDANGPEEDRVGLTAHALTGGGMPLTSPVRRYFEHRLGRDLAAVRVHSGTQAVRWNDRLQARAFAYRSHIWLGEGERPERSYLMAHELAHVVQQTHPDRLHGAAPSGGPGPGPDTIQRLPFWAPIDTRQGKLVTGSAIHKEIQDTVNGKKGIDVEAAVPNAIRSDRGLGLQGSADLYRASSRVGIYFDGPVGSTEGNFRFSKPDKHFRAGRSGKPAIDRGGGIKDIGGAPTDIAIGELKPASLEELKKGSAQLDNYAAGFEDAQKLTNEWARDRGVPDRWDPKVNVTRLGDADVPLPSTFTFNRTSPRTDRSLALVDIKQTRGAKEQTKYKLDPLFVPKHSLGQEIKGGLYAAHYQNGLWMYYARPADLAAAMDLPRFRKREAAAYMRVAESVQDEVIGDLKQAPDTVQGKRARQAGPDPEARRAGVRVTDARGERAIRLKKAKKKKPTKLQDRFDLRKWKRRQGELRDILEKDRAGGKPRGQPGSKTFEKLRFLDLAYRAEEALASQAGPPSLPKKSTLIETIKTGKPPRQTTSRRALPDLYPWMSRWTSRPVEKVGVFRDKFGTAFVSVADKLSKLIARIREKVKSIFEKRKARMTQSGYGALALKALGTALVKIANLFVPHTIGLVVGAVRSGIEKQLEKLFGDIESQLLKAEGDEDSALGDVVASLEAAGEQMNEFGAKADAYVEAITTEYGKKLEPVKDVAALAKKLGPILEVGMILVQCGTPPGWGCLKLLAGEAIKRATDKVLDVCYVQKKVACLVADMAVFQRLPNDLAETIMTHLRTNVATLDVPDEIKAIFDEPIPKEALPDCDEIPCEATGDRGEEGAEAAGGAGAGAGAGAGRGAAKEPDKDAEAAAEALAALANSVGGEKIEALADLVDRAGIPDATRFDQAHADKLKALLKDISAAEMRAAAAGSASPGVLKKLEPLADFLDGVARAEAMREAQAKFQAGAFDRDLDELRRSGNWWRLVGSYRIGRSRNRILLVHVAGTDAAGVVDVVIGPCQPSGKVPVEFERIELRGRDGKPVDLKLPTKTEADVGSGCAAPPSGGIAAGAPPESDRQGGTDEGGGAVGGRESEGVGRPESEGEAEAPDSGDRAAAQGGGVVEVVESEAEDGEGGTEPPAPTEAGPAEEGEAREGPAVAAEGGGERAPGKRRTLPIGAEMRGGTGWPVGFEPLASAHGFELYAGTGKNPPNAIVLPDNQRAIITPVRVGGSELVLKLDGPNGQEIGRARPYPALADTAWELRSGPLFDALQSQLRPWLRQRRMRFALDERQYPRRLLFHVRWEPLQAGDEPMFP